MKNLLLIAWLLILFLPTVIQAQKENFHDQLASGYEQQKESTISTRRFKHADIQPLIQKFDLDKRFEVRRLGASIEGRPISLISIGEGDIDILLWSQMHGNESTATMAIFDVLNFIADRSILKEEKEQLLKNVKVHFLPMLNPDGAEKFQRRNALDIDINRDALRLQSPEGQILKSVRDSLDAEFGFNLHDQSKYSNAELTPKPATISYLAPAYNYEKEINEVRANAMKIIVHMNRIVQQYAPGQVGRYSDDFEPRAFGDNIQKWGTSAILIESGGHYNDPEKQFIRKLNYISILSSIFIIADGSYQQLELSEYEEIPRNDRKLFDIKIENLTYNLLGEDYLLDVGIVRNEVDNAEHNDFHYSGSIAEVGDLSTYFGYETIDATGLRFQPGKLSKGANPKDLSSEDFKKLLNQGYTDLKIESTALGTHSEFPINLVRSKSPREVTLNMGQEATFLLMDGDELKYVVVNGFLYNPRDGKLNIKNGALK